MGDGELMLEYVFFKYFLETPPSLADVFVYAAILALNVDETFSLMQPRAI